MEEWSRRQSSVRDADCRMIAAVSLSGRSRDESGSRRVRGLAYFADGSVRRRQRCAWRGGVSPLRATRRVISGSQRSRGSYAPDERSSGRAYPVVSAGTSATSERLLVRQGGVWLGFWNDGGCVVSQGSLSSAPPTLPPMALGKGLFPDLQLDRDGALWAATRRAA